MHRRTLLKALGLGTVVGSTSGCDAVGGIFGRMFAVPPRETTYFTPNAKLLAVNHAVQRHLEPHYLQQSQTSQ